MKKGLKKTISLLLLVTMLLFAFAACGDAGNTAADGGQASGDSGAASDSDLGYDVYKYMKITNSNASQLYYPAMMLFDDPGAVGSGDTLYKPCLVAEFDTQTGHATKVELYAFFLDNEDDEWVNQAIEAYETADDSYKDEVTNVTKGRVNDSVSYLHAEIDPSSYGVDQYIQMLFYNQDIEHYKDEIFFSRLYNYDTEPAHEEGDNFFEESLEGQRIEWSNSPIDALSGEPYE